MAGLLLLGAWALYLLFIIGPIFFAWRWAGRNGHRRWLWSLIAGIVMYHVAAWELIPVHLAVNYYCSKEGGLKVYKSLEQWKGENPGVAEKLIWQDNSPSLSSRELPKAVVGGWQVMKFYDGYELNERIIELSQQTSLAHLPVRISQKRLVDVETNEMLASWTTVRGGYEFSLNGDMIGLFRFYVYTDGCSGAKVKDKLEEYHSLRNDFKQLGRKADISAVGMDELTGVYKDDRDILTLTYKDSDGVTLKYRSRHSSRFKFVDGVLSSEELNDRYPIQFIDSSGKVYLTQIRGTAGNDVIYGGVGNDEIFGTKEDDILDGGRGDDILRGMGGNNIYVFRKGDGKDTVYSNNTDTVRFLDVAMGELTGVYLWDSNLVITYGKDDQIIIPHYSFHSFHGVPDKIILFEFTDGILSAEELLTHYSMKASIARPDRREGEIKRAISGDVQKKREVIKDREEAVKRAILDVQRKREIMENRREAERRAIIDMQKIMQDRE